MRYKTIRSVKRWQGTRALVRCDFNVALRNGRIAEDFKIIQSLPTLRYILANGGIVIAVSHLGRPDGRRRRSLSLAPVARYLERHLGRPVTFIADFQKPAGREALRALRPGGIALLENIRFFPEEEAGDRRFAKQLAALADVYVNDALAVSHRAHASVAGVQRYVPAYAGCLLEKELAALEQVRQPEQPFVVVMGGAKLATKVAVIKKLRRKASHILVGGMLAYPFLAAAGASTGKFTPDPREVRLAKKLRSEKIILPADYVVSAGKNGTGPAKVVAGDAIPNSAYQLDIGPETVRKYAAYIKASRTVLWNGPLGMFERDRFKHGTLGVARLVGTRGAHGFAVAGGGETVLALRQAQVMDDVDWVSTGGGAMLAYLAGERLPGLKKIVRRW